MTHHVVIETQYRSHIPTAVAVIRRRPHLYKKKYKEKKTSPSSLLYLRIAQMNYKKRDAYSYEAFILEHVLETFLYKLVCATY